MSVKLVMLKSGEDIIADVKELKTEEGIVGYYFHDPLIVKMYHPEEPTVLNEDGSSRLSMNQKLVFNFILGFLFQKNQEYLVQQIGW